MAQQLTNNKVEQTLKYSSWYIFFHSLTIGLGEKFIEAFAFFLKASNLQFSLLTPLSQFFGSTIQLFTYRLLSIFKSRKLMNIVLIVIQGLVWIPIFLLALQRREEVVWFYMLMVLIYYCCAFLINPIWNSWMMDLVLPEQRGKFYGKRHVIINSVVLLSYLLGGAALHYSQRTFMTESYGFMLLFGLAAAGNLLAATMLLKKHEPEYTIVKPKTSLKKFMMSMRQDNQGRIVLYLVLMTIAVYIASPFYTPYILRSLNFSYIEFTILMLIPVIPKILFSKKAGKLIDKYGPKTMLKLASILIVFTPLLWILNKSFW
ncbi:MAG: MFS transporter, partial [Candidatus Woesearchaeota archaeon]